MPVATPVSRAAFTKAWNSGITLAKMGAKFGMHPRTVGQKAVSFGLPDRTTWPKKPRHPMLDDILGMYRMGVAIRQISAAVNLDYCSVRYHAKRNGEQFRGTAFKNRANRPTPADWFAVKPEIMLAERMAASAAETNAALARMVRAERGLFKPPSKASAQAAP